LIANGSHSVDSIGADATVRSRRDRGACRACADGRRCHAGTGSRRFERRWLGILPLSWTSPDEIASVVEEKRTLEREPVVEDGVVSGILDRVGAVATAGRTI
jgi:hypothetical protein